MINDIRIEEPDYTSRNIKMIIDDFDIIAFDNLLASFEFIDHIENHNKELTTFYFHELMYYLKTAILKTKAVIDCSDKTINSDAKVDVIDLFRVYNAHSMMVQIIEKINNIAQPMIADTSVNVDMKINIYNERLRKVLQIQISDINEDIKAIGKRCEEVLEEHYKDKGLPVSL